MPVLTPENIESYQKDGCLFPIKVLDDYDVKRLRGALEKIESDQGFVMDRAQCNKSYLLFDWADELVHNEEILRSVESLIGPNILCYMTNLFIKEAGSASYVSMHQDAAYWGVDADDVVTAWVALSPAKKESGVMKVRLGSHHQEYKQVNTYAKDNLLSRGQEIPAEALAQGRDTYMELDAGEMSLHHYKLAHGSDANKSDDRRIGFAIRYVASDAKKVGRPESALLVRGKSGDGFLAERRAKDLDDSVRHVEHARALRRQIYNLFQADAGSDFKERLRLGLTKIMAILLSYQRELKAKFM